MGGCGSGDMGMAIQEKLGGVRPRKLLALDGGGIRGLISIEVLAAMEEELRREAGRADYVLADYFDYIAGTSTGAVIATCLSLGMSVARVRDFYLTCGREMFSRAAWFHRHKYKYEEDKLTRILQDNLGVETRLGTDKLKTLLMIVVRNATTDSPWPISNNPAAKFNAAGPECNLEMPLWQLVRASTAAPTFFPPEEVVIGGKRHVFVDGAVTVFNNPALQLFVMATARPYNLCWPTGVGKLLLVSVGTGVVPHGDAALEAGKMTLLYSASSVPAALIGAAQRQQDLMCRLLGECRAGEAIDSEVGDLRAHGWGGTETGEKQFAYVRYNVALTREGLDGVGLTGMSPAVVRPLDSGEHLEALAEVGRAVARARVRAEHWRGFGV